MKEYSVAISYGNDLGWIDYDAEAKAAKVTLAHEDAKAKVEAYLSKTHKISIPHDSLMDFTEEEVEPLADLESFQLALTRLWGETEVQVDWSRPVDYVKEHRRYGED